MPRVKSSDQIEALERQRRDLLAKLKEAKAKAREAERERRAKSAAIAGQAVLDEVAENPQGSLAVAVRQILNTRVTRRVDRQALGLSDAMPESAPQAETVAE